jgi:hypothetical protein
MAETIYSGAEVPTNSDPYNLTADLRKMALSLTMPIAVMNVSARNALQNEAPGGVFKVGQPIIRRDQSMLTEIWDGAGWVTGKPHTEWSSNGIVVGTAATIDVGALTQDAAKTTDSAFVTHPQAGALRFRDAGTYAITFTGVASALMTGRSFLEIQAAGGVVYRSIVTGEDRGYVSIANYRAAANELMVFDAYHNSGAARTLGFRIAVTRVA